MHAPAQAPVRHAAASTRMDLDELSLLMDALSTKATTKANRGSRNVKMASAATRATSRATAGKRAQTFVEEQSKASKSTRQSKPSAKQLLKALERQANAKWNTDTALKIEKAKEAIVMQQTMVEKAAAALKEQEVKLARLRQTLAMLEDDHRTGRGQMDVIKEGGRKK